MEIDITESKLAKEFLAKAKTKCVCDSCGLSIELGKSKPEKGKDGKTKPAKPNPAIRATLEYPVGSGETQAFEFCQEACLLNFLKKRY